MAPIVITQQTSTRVYDLLVQREIDDSRQSALIDTADWLQQNSPRGVSNPGDSLAGDWDIVPGRPTVGIADLSWRDQIVNSLPDASFRVAGRGPGGFPPFQRGSALAAWATVKGIPPFLVARKIATLGTDRWQTGQNILGMDRSGNIPANGPATQVYTEAFNNSWNQKVIG